MEKKCECQESVPTNDFKTLLGVITLLMGKTSPEEYQIAVNTMLALCSRYGMVEKLHATGQEGSA